MKFPVRTSLNLDERLIADAQGITEISEKAILVREGLRALIEPESARQPRGDMGEAH